MVFISFSINIVQTDIILFLILFFKVRSVFSGKTRYIINKKAPEVLIFFLSKCSVQTCAWRPQKGTFKKVSGEYKNVRWF